MERVDDRRRRKAAGPGDGRVYGLVAAGNWQARRQASGSGLAVISFRARYCLVVLPSCAHGTRPMLCLLTNGSQRQSNSQTQISNFPPRSRSRTVQLLRYCPHLCLPLSASADRCGSVQFMNSHHRGGAAALDFPPPVCAYCMRWHTPRDDRAVCWLLYTVYTPMRCCYQATSDPAAWRTRACVDL